MTLTFLADNIETQAAWHLRAACRPSVRPPSILIETSRGPVSVEPVFLPTTPDRRGSLTITPHQVRAALCVCATCGVVDECADAARRLDVHYGIWGGKRLTPKRGEQ